eukprot:UN23136
MFTNTELLLSLESEVQEAKSKPEAPQFSKNIMEEEKSDQTEDSGPDDDEGLDEENFVTFDEIQQSVQASDAQILSELKVINAFKLNGYFRLLDETYWWQAFDDIMNYVLQNDIEITNVDKNKIISEIKDFPKDVVIHVLEHITESSKDDILKLDANKIGSIRAVQVLAKHKGPIPKDLLIEKWLETVPLGSEMNDDLLAGHAITTQQKHHKECWTRFEESNLPFDPKERFNVLFEKKQKWTEKELLPFLSGLKRAGHKVDKMLLSHTRIIRERVDGVQMKCFKPRHVKY